MRRKYLLILFIIIILSLVTGLFFYKEKYQFQGRTIVKVGLINDMRSLNVLIKTKNITNYKTFFDNLKTNGEILNVSFILKKLVNNDILLNNNVLVNGVKDKFILGGYNKNCFYFRLKSNELRGNEKYLSNYLKDEYFQKCSNKNCYIIFTEKGLLKSDDLYDCK